MTTVNRVRVEWTGPAVAGPGVSTFYSVGVGSNLSDALLAYFGNIKTAFPTGVTWRVPSSGDTLDDNTGEINGTWSGATGGTVSGSSASQYAAGVGYRVVWDTAGLTNGRHVRGSTYMVPITANFYDTSGTIDDSVLGAQLTAAQNLLAALGPEEMVVLTRLTAAHSGTSHPVTGVSIPDKVSWLRTRRT